MNLRTLYLLIAGGRDFNDYEYLKQSVEEVINNRKQYYLSQGWDIPWQQIKVVSGNARGADTLGEKWAIENGWDVIDFPANWDKYGKSAGPIRNSKIVEFLTWHAYHQAIFFWDKISSGTANCIECCQRNRIPLQIFNYT